MKPLVQVLAKAERGELAANLASAGFRTEFANEPELLSPDGCIVVDAEDFPPSVSRSFAAPFVVVLTQDRRDIAKAWAEAGARGLFLPHASPRELAVRLNSASRLKHNVVCIGGGTGLFQLLSGLKAHSGVHLTSVVTVTDDGGSSGRLRTQLGVLPPGDIRRSLVALSDAPELMNAVIQHRFSAGDGIAGHSLGNLVLTALSEITGSLGGAVRALGDIMHIRGIVAGATNDDATLCAEMEDGRVIRTEAAIDTGEGRPPELRIARLFHDPPARCGVDVYSAILAADMVIVGPGDLYTSLIANLVVDGIAQALTETKAKVVYVLNLMTKPGETAHYSTADHVRALVKHVGEDFIDTVIASKTEPDPGALRAYASNAQVPVRGQLDGASEAALIVADVSDPLQLVRHDPEKLAEVIAQLCETPPAEDTVDLRVRDAGD